MLIGCWRVFFNIFEVMLGYKLIMFIGWVLIGEILSGLLFGVVSFFVFSLILIFVLSNGGKLGELKVLNLLVLIFLFWLFFSKWLLKNKFILVIG